MKRATIRRDMRMNRAHEEKISFWAESGSGAMVSTLRVEARVAGAYLQRRLRRTAA